MKEYSEDQAIKYRKKYSKRKQWRYISLVPFFLLAAVTVIARLSPDGFLGIPFRIAEPVAYAALLTMVVLRIIAEDVLSTTAC